MALLNGIFNTTMNPAELNMDSFAASILRLFPSGSAPMFALSSQSGRSRAVASTHGYFSKTMAFISQVLAATYTDAATDIVVPSVVGMTTKMVIHNLMTGENMRITAINTGTDTITVTRAFGRVAAAAGSISDVLISIGTAHEEGSVRPTARGLSTIHVPNFTQIFRNTWGVTGTAQASKAHLGFSNVAENRQDNAMFHSTDIEAAIIWGQAKMDVTGAQPLHSTQGVLDAIAQYAPNNLTTAGGTTTMAQLEAALTPLFAYSTDIGNPTQRVVFCDNQALKVFNQIGRLSGQVFLNNEQTTFGMRFSTFVFYLGTLTLVSHPLMNGIGTPGTAIVMDMPALKLAYMDGRDTNPEEYNAQGQQVELGTDGIGGSLTTELAVELINPSACGVIDNLTAGA